VEGRSHPSRPRQVFPITATAKRTHIQQKATIFQPTPQQLLPRTACSGFRTCYLLRHSQWTYQRSRQRRDMVISKTKACMTLLPMRPRMQALMICFECSMSPGHELPPRYGLIIGGTKVHFLGCVYYWSWPLQACHSRSSDGKANVIGRLFA
jgi:hypothetical protein